MRSVDGKGKEKDPFLLKLGLKWKGRYSRVEDAGLPTMPPGKMFRTDLTEIPPSTDER